MKKFFFFAAALLSAGMLSAQTIAIDGAAADWANVPMLTEPGAAGPMVKMIVPQEGVSLPDGAAFCLLVENDGRTDYPVIYTDADCNNTTGTAPWICPAMGYDYEMATWSSGSLYARAAAVEMCIMKAAFSGVAFSGVVDASLTYAWGALYIPTDPTTDSWTWSAEVRHPFHVAPYTMADLSGEHTAAAAISSHYAFTLKENKFDFNVTGGSQDTAFWISWPVEVTPAKYTVSANVFSTDNASCDLYLVNMATNAVVATHTTENVWQPAGETAFGEWDLSAVPAGKYMLKMKNHVAWSHMVLTSVSLKAATTTAIEQTATEKPSVKRIENGQLVIIRDGVRYSVLGM